MTSSCAAPVVLAIALAVGAAQPAAALPAPLVDCTPPRAVADPVAPAAAERMRLAAAHLLATGRGQRIAVIDTGVAPHPRLAGRLVGLDDQLATDDAQGTGLDDCDGHGTAVAGLIAAAPDPGDGLVGVAPAAEILSLRQFSPSVDAVDARRADLRPLAAAVTSAVRAGATVVNISGAVCLPAVQAAAAAAPVQAALRLAAAADVVVVAAAGNLDSGGCTRAEPGSVALPGMIDDLLTVGAVGADDRPAAFTVPGPWVDVAAPGTGIRSLTVDGGTGAPLDGTSFAAPYVAGVAALLRERHPELTAREVADRILTTARRPAGGRDDAVGHGVVDPVAALTAEPVVREDAATVPTVALARDAPAPTAAWPGAALALLLVAGTLAVGVLRRLSPRRPARRRPGLPP